MMSGINESVIHTRLKENGYLLLGQIGVSDQEYQDLERYLKVRLSHLYVQTSPVPSLMISLALVQIAIRHYKDGTFWDCFKQRMGVELAADKTTYLGQIFYQTIARYDLFCPIQEGKRMQYVECIKAHAFVTNAYMDGFFDFADAYYENNLFREITDDIDEDLEDLSTFMAATLSEKKDTITSGTGSPKTAKSYRLLKSTRTVFAQCDTNTIHVMFCPILELMDRYFYDNEIPQVPRDRFESGFAAWCGRKRERKERTAGTRGLYSHKPYLRVDVNREQMTLVIPPQKFRANDCIGQASAVITAGGHTHSFPLELYRSFGIYISEELRIPVGSIFDAVEISIEALAKKEYRIPAANYRIFNDSWGSLDRFSRGHNYILVRPGISTELEQPEDLIDSDTYRNWQYYSLKIGEASVFYVGNRPLSLIGEYSSEPVFEKYVENMTVRDRAGRKLTAARCHPAVSFVVEKRRFKGTALVVNDRNYSIDALAEKTCCDWPGDRNKIAVNVDLNRVLPRDDGFYDIRLDVPGCANQQLCGYALLRKLRFKFNKPRYMYDAEAVLSITTGGHDLRIPDPEWQLVNESGDTATYTFPLVNPPEEITFDVIADREYRICIPLRIFRYGFSRSAMRTQKEEYIWYSDLGETLYVQIPGAVSAGAYLEKDETRMAPGTMLEPGLFRIDISEFRYHIQQSNTRRCHYLNIRYEDNTARRVALPVIYRNVLIEPYFKTRMKNGVAYVDVNIKGNAEVYLTVNDQNRQTVIDHRAIHSGINYLQELEPGKLYAFFPTMEEADEFGLDVEVTPLKALLNTGIVDRNDLTDCRLPVEAVVFEGRELELAYDYFLDLRRKINADIYEGFMYGLKLDQNRKYVKDKNGNLETMKLKRVLVYADLSAEGQLDVGVQCFSTLEREWMSLFYDMEEKAVIHYDNELLDETGCEDRFLTLEEASTVFRIAAKRVKKLKGLN